MLQFVSCLFWCHSSEYITSIRLEEVIPLSVLPLHGISIQLRNITGEIFMVKKWVHTLPRMKAVSIDRRLLLSLKVLDVAYYPVHNGGFFCYEIGAGIN